MLEKRYNGNFVQLYDSVDDLPIERFQKFNLNMMIDGGIGGDLEAVDRRIGNLNLYLQQKQYDDLVKELANFHQALHFIISDLNPKFRAFVCMIYAINGKQITDLSDDGIQKAIETLEKTGITFGKLNGWLGYVKKNLTKKLKSIFPASPTKAQSESITAA